MKEGGRERECNGERERGRGGERERGRERVSKEKCSGREGS